MRQELRVVLTLATAVLAACGRQAGPPASNADVIVIGAGLAGVSAALEAESRGARVLVLDANSVGGGHAVKASGFALVDTPLQRARGLEDSPETAQRDLLAWGEDADAAWVRRYAENSRAEVYDWLTGLGVKFVGVQDTPESAVARFHVTRGGAVHAVVPLLQAALRRPRIEFVWSTEATEIVMKEGRVAGVRARRLRAGATSRVWRAPAVIVATGGFESNLAEVRRHWSAALPPPDRLLIGSGQFATGSGLQLAQAVGAGVMRLDHQEIRASGLPDPRDPAGDQGLEVQDPAAIWVDSTGRRFTNEDAPGKVTERAILGKTPATYWMVFDARGEKRLSIRGAAWLTPDTIAREILANPAVVRRADSIAGLAAAAGLPPEALIDTVERFNRFIEQKMDTDFGRLGAGSRNLAVAPLREPPFYALQLFPMSRRSMGGLDIDADGRVRDRGGQPVPGLFAAGEVTGVAGINGSHAGSGTFLGPSVLLGRLAARGAAAAAGVQAPAAGSPVLAPAGPTVNPPANPVARPTAAPGGGTSFRPGVLANLLRQSRPGYWHFEVSHRLVLERAESCAGCHRGAWSPAPATTREQHLTELESCTHCH